jgi:hypothetical protein
MFILHFLPDALINWVTYTILLAGAVLTIAGFFVSIIPFVSQYKLPIQIIGVLLLTLGVYFRGGYSVEMEWRQRVEELEEKVQAAQVLSKKVNTVIVTKLVKQIEVVKIHSEGITKYIDREIVKYDNICPVPEPVVEAHNAAAENRAINK